MTATIVIRWSARLLSALILAFWGFLLVAHLLGDAGRSSRPLTPLDYAILSAMVLSLIGLVMAWRWELTGALLTLGAVLVNGLINWRVLIFPGALVPIAAALFLCSWCLTRRARATMQPARERAA